MPESRHDFGVARRIEAQSFGRPGRRTFRVYVANAERAASLWMEKEQLAALGAHIEGQLNRLRAMRYQGGTATPDPATAYTGEPDLDFRVGQLALGFDERAGLFLLFAYSADDEDEDEPTFSCQATPEQFRELADAIARIIAAGRPICPLCGLPMDPDGHACARANGHLKLPIPPRQAGEDE